MHLNHKWNKSVSNVSRTKQQNPDGLICHLENGQPPANMQQMKEIHDSPNVVFAHCIQISGAGFQVDFNGLPKLLLAHKDSTRVYGRHGNSYILVSFTRVSCCTFTEEDNRWLEGIQDGSHTSLFCSSSFAPCEPHRILDAFLAPFIL